MDRLSDFASRIQEKLEIGTRAVFAYLDQFLARQSNTLGRFSALTKDRTRFSVLAVVTLLVTCSVLFVPKSSATLSSFYPSTCTGGWLNPQNATLVQSVDDGQPANAYTDKNSAVLHGTHSDIVCANFAGSIPTGTTPKTFNVKLHWSIDDGSVSHAEVVNATDTNPSVTSDSTPAPTPTPTPTETPAPSTDTPTPDATPTPTPTPTADTTPTPAETPVVTPAPTSADAPAPAPETAPAPEVAPTPDATPAPSLAPAPAPTVDATPTVATALKKAVASLDALATDALSAGDTTMFHSTNDIFAVRYSVDGENWTDIGTVNAANWQTATFAISGSDVSNWSDFSKLHLGLFSLSNDTTQPAVYLDAMEVSVDYAEDTPSAVVPTVKVTDPSIAIVAPQKDNFTLDEAPVFSVTNPNLSTNQIANLVHEEKAVVISDNLGVFSETPTQTDSSKNQSTTDTNTNSTADSSSTLVAPAQQSTPTSTTPEVTTTTDTTTQATKTESPTPAPIQTPTPENTSSETTPTATPDQTPAPDATPVTNSTTTPTTTPASAPALDATPAPAPAPETTSTPDSTLGASAIGALGTNATSTTKTQPIRLADIKHSLASATLRFYSTMTRIARYSFANALLALAGDTASPSPIDAVVLDAAGNQTTIAVTVQHVTVDGVAQDQVVVEKPDNMFHPGKYTLQVTLHTPEVNIVSEQDFSWGVLAVNVDRSIYHAGDTAYVQMGVIDDFGHTICDADMTLVITSPLGVEQTYTTSDATIVREPQCGPDNYILVPDYYAHAPIGDEVGVYHMTLTANTKNGIRTVHDAFTVSSEIPFDVVRSGPTRVYPADAYPSKMQITSPVDWSGTVVETVPSPFGVSQLDGVVGYDTQTTTGDVTTITWNVSLLAGKPMTIGYDFLPPPISPEFYLLGPLSFYNQGDDIATATPIFKEARRWQIADDASCTYIGPSVGFWNNASNWSCSRVPTTGSNTDDVTIPAGSTVTLDTSTPASGGTLNSLTIAGTLKTGNSGGTPTDYNVTTNTLTISSGGVLNATSVASGSTITLVGGGTGASRPFQNSGTFTCGSSTIQYKGPVTDIESVVYYNLNIDLAGSGSDSLTANTTVLGTLDIGDHLSSSITLSTYNSGIGTGGTTFNLTAGHILLGGGGATGILSANSSTITLTGDTATPLFKNNNTPGSFLSGTSTIVVATDYSGGVVFGGTTTTNINNITFRPTFAGGTPCATGACTYLLGVIPTVSGTFDINPNVSGMTVTVDVNNSTTSASFGASSNIKIEGTGGGLGIMTATGCTHGTMPDFSGSAASYLPPSGTSCYAKQIDVESGGTFNGGTTFFQVANILVGSGGQFNAGTSAYIYTDGSVLSNQINIQSGGTFNGGGSIIHITGAPTGTTNTFMNNAGSFTAGTSTFYINPVLGSATVNQYLNSGSWTGNNKFYNFYLQAYDTGMYLQLGADTEVGNTFAFLKFGTQFDTNNYNLTVGTLDLCHSAGVGIFKVTNTSGTKNITLTGTTASLVYDTASGNGALSFACTGALSAANFPTTTANFIVKSNASVSIFSIASISFANFTFSPTLSSSVVYTMGTSITLSGNITSSPASSTGSQTLALSGALTIPATKTFTVQSDSATSTSLLSNYSVGFINIISGTLLANNTAITITGALTTGSVGTVGALFTNTGTFTPGTSTVTFNGANTTGLLTSGTFVSGSTTNNFYNLTLNNAGATYTLGSAIEATGTTGVTVTLGILDTSTSQCAPSTSCNITTTFLRVDGTLTARAATIKLNGTGTPATLFTRNGTFTAGTSTVQVTTPSGVARFLSGANTTFHNITIGDTGVSATIVNAGNNFTIDTTGTFYVKNGVFNQDGATVITVGASSVLQMDNGTTYCLGGTSASTTANCASGATGTTALTWPAFGSYSLNAGSTIAYKTNATSQTVSASPAYGNLSLTPVIATSGKTYTLGGAMTINGNFTIQPTGAAFLLTVNAGGNITASGTTAIGGTTATGTLFLRPVSTTYNLTTNALTTTTGGTLDGGTGGTASVITVTTNVTNGGTITTGNSGITLGGNWTNTGTFTAGTSSVVTFNSGTTATVSGATTFVSLVIAPGVGVSKEVDFTAGQTFVVGAGGFTVTGHSGNLVKLFSTDHATPTQWKIQSNTANTVAYADVRDAGCGASMTAMITTSNTTNDGGNNAACWTFGVPYLNFSLSNNAVDFGNLPLGTVRYATSSAGGSGLDTVAQTINVSTSGTGGFNLYVQGSTPSNGVHAMHAIGCLNTTVFTTTEQFGLRLDTTGPGKVAGDSSLTASFPGQCDYGGSGAGFAYNGVSAPSLVGAYLGSSPATTVYNVHYLAYSVGSTSTGSYTTSLTYTVLGNF